MFEMIFRTALLYANLMQGPHYRLSRSEPYDVLDPSEKGAVSYFLGLTFAKLFAEKYLNVSWLMHLDVYRDALRPRNVHGGSKPDLVGFDTNGDWYVIEAKGRTGGHDSEAMRRAKEQVSNLSTIAHSDRSCK